MILGGGQLAAPAEPSVLEAFLGVDPGYLKSSLDRLQLLMWLSMAAGLSAAVVVAIKGRQR
jgi:hypothetical protein